MIAEKLDAEKVVNLNSLLEFRLMDSACENADGDTTHVWWVVQASGARLSWHQLISRKRQATMTAWGESILMRIAAIVPRNVTHDHRCGYIGGHCWDHLWSV